MATRGGTILSAVRAAPVALVAVLVACVPPTVGHPGVQDPGEGRGRDPATSPAPSGGCRAGPAPVGGRITVEWQGRHRSAVVRLPTTDGVRPAPLLLSLHPFSVDGAGWEQYSGLAAAAAVRGYVAVTPLGSSPGPRWSVPGGLDLGVDDLGFLSALVDVVEDTWCLDRNRYFAGGFSAGAAMAQALSCTQPDRFVAVAGSGGMNLTDTCPASPPTDVLVLHGTADPIAPPSGSQVVFAPPLGLSIDTVVATNASRAGCDPAPGASTPVTGVEELVHTGCSDGHRVVHWRLLGAGHTWAGTATLLDLVVGPTPTNFSATRVVLDFFDATA